MCNLFYQLNDFFETVIFEAYDPSEINNSEEAFWAIYLLRRIKTSSPSEAFYLYISVKALKNGHKTTSFAKHLLNVLLRKRPVVQQLFNRFLFFPGGISSWTICQHETHDSLPAVGICEDGSARCVP